MTRVSRVAVLAALFAAWSGSAGAADLPLPMKAPPAVAAGADWSGWYAGPNLGVVRGDEAIAWTAAPSVGGFLPAGAADVNASSPGHVTTAGFTGGGQIGYNRQIQSLVVGLEADLDYTEVNGTRNLLSGTFQNPYTQSVQSNWLGTIRGRLGAPCRSWLFYATGGLAVAHESFTDNFLGLHGVGPINSSVGATRAGWAAGAGVEWAVAGAWSVKAEYLHVDLGTLTDVGASAINAATITHAHGLTEDIGRVGFNYRFAH